MYIYMQGVLAGIRGANDEGSHSSIDPWCTGSNMHGGAGMIDSVRDSEHGKMLAILERKVKCENIMALRADLARTL